MRERLLAGNAGRRATRSGGGSVDGHPRGRRWSAGRPAARWDRVRWRVLGAGALPPRRATRLVVPDVPGLGESEPVARLDVETFADWLTGLIRSTCDERPMLVAHSLLGSLAARYAARHSDSLRRLAIYGTPGVGAIPTAAGFMAAAILFDFDLPSAISTGSRAGAFHLDPDLARRPDPEWLEAFDAYTSARGAVPARASGRCGT